MHFEPSITEWSVTNWYKPNEIGNILQNDWSWCEAKLALEPIAASTGYGGVKLSDPCF